MIHYLKIRNFGAIKNEVEINFEVAENQDADAYEVKMPDGRRLLKLAYIYGANASGKTTVLKAFDFLRYIILQPASEKSTPLPYDPFLFCENALSRDSYFECSFYHRNIRNVYSLRFDKRTVLEEKLFFYQTSRPSELFSRETDPEKRLAKIQFGSRIKVPARERDLLESNTLHNNTVFGAYARTNVDIPELEELSKWLNGFLLQMITSSRNLTEVTTKLMDDDPATNEWINTMLHKADEQIVKIEIPEDPEFISYNLRSDDIKQINYTNKIEQNIRSNKKIDTVYKSILPKSKMGNLASSLEELLYRKVKMTHHVGDGKDYVLPIQSESSGTKRYFGLAGLLYYLIHGDRFLCVDELETSLHPDLIKHFLQVFLMNSKTSQLLFTTHNLSMMADEDFIRRDALWFTEKEPDGSVSLYSAADFDSSTLRKDASLIKAYMSGRLGAKPNLGSPLIAE